MGETTAKSGNYVSYHSLIVHQRADELAFKVYEVTKKLPREELLGITSQMRRAATSVPANIAEGYARHGNREKIRFLNISRGSLTELRYFVEFSLRLGYLQQVEHNVLAQAMDETGKLLCGYIKAIKNKCSVSA